MASEIFWTQQSAYPILSTLQLLPILGVVVVYLLRNSLLAVKAGIAIAVLEFFVTIHLYLQFDVHHSGFQFAEKFEFFAPFSYHVAVDGISVLFLLLTSILTIMLVLYGLIRGLKPTYGYIVAIFSIEASLIGMFVTQNLFWFLILSTVEIVLVGYLLWRWATTLLEDIAMRRYMQFMGTGLLLLFLGTIMLGWNHADVTGRWSFDLQSLMKTPVPISIQSTIFFLLFYGFAIRIPLFPLHGWLPVMAQHGTVAIAGVFLLGLKTGIYGLIRFVFPIVPEAVIRWHEFVVAFAVVGIFYAAVLAITQENLRRLLAFAVVSHTSVLVIGLFTLQDTAFQGSIMLSINFGLAISILLFTTGMVYRRTRTLVLTKLGGLFDHIPIIGIAFLVASLSIIGMPGTPGFDAVHLMLEAAIHKFGALVTIAAALGNVVAAGFLLWAFQSAFLRPANPSTTQEIEKTTRLEFILTSSLIVILLSAGFYSEPWLQLIELSTQNIIQTKH